MEAENISTTFVTSHDTTWCYNINFRDKIGSITLQEHINPTETTERLCYWYFILSCVTTVKDGISGTSDEDRLS